MGLGRSSENYSLLEKLKDSGKIQKKRVTIDFVVGDNSAYMFANWGDWEGTEDKYYKPVTAGVDTSKDGWYIPINNPSVQFEATYLT